MRVAEGTDLHIDLDGGPHNSSEPIHRRICAALRAAIVDGTVAAGQRMPSVRQVAQDCGVNRATALRAYQQLAVEGFVEARYKSGYVACAIDAEFARRTHAQRAVDLPQTPPERQAFVEAMAPDARYAYDFAYARLAPGSFPVRTWARLVADAARDSADELLCAYPYTAEPCELQRELSAYLGRARGVVCAPEQVVICPSTEFALQTVLQLVDLAGRPVGAEEPGYVTLVDVARRLGLPVVPLASDRGPERFLADVRAARPAIVFATPSHQFPTGTVMPVGMRIELLKWAREHGALVIEDDACGEYRYGTDPVPTLYSRDPQTVVYLGNFSKTLAPGLRVAYLVLPPALLRAYGTRFAHSCTAVDALTQQALARFIAQGHMARHVHAMVAGNRARHDVLLRCLRERLEGAVEVEGVDSGMHLYVTVHNGMDQGHLIRSAAKLGARVYRTDAFWFANPAPANKVILGFSYLAAEKIPAGVDALRRAWVG